MTSKKRRSFTKIFLVFFLVAIMCQWMFFQDQNLHVKGQSTSLDRSIDLYTQKEPYDGRGPNQSSDAFAPGEEVILYAYVTYRDDPVPGQNIAFEVHGPVNRFENLSFARTAVTDDGGVASVCFRIMWPDGYPEETIVGVWDAVAVVDLAGVLLSDDLSFRVGWIVRLIEVETVDINNVSRTGFMRDECMYFRLTVENIAMTDKTATIVIDVYDSLGTSLGNVVLLDEQIAPGVTVLLIRDFLVPEWASLGVGVVYVNAYTALPASAGVSWCPQIFTTFSIVPAIVHDVSVVSVVPSVTEAFPNQVVNVSVVVRNEGNTSENFDVCAYYDSILIGMFIVRNIAPQMDENIIFRWYTCCLQPGNYTLSAVAGVVPGEVDVDDNTFVNGVVRIKASEPYPPGPVECALPKWLLALLFLLALLAGASLIFAVGFALWRMRERKNHSLFAASANASTVKLDKRHPSKATKTCSACGREFPAVYTFCPYCFAYQSDESM